MILCTKKKQIKQNKTKWNTQIHISEWASAHACISVVGGIQMWIDRNRRQYDFKIKCYWNMNAHTHICINRSPAFGLLAYHSPFQHPNKVPFWARCFHLVKLFFIGQLCDDGGGMMVCRSLFGFSISFFGAAVFCLCLYGFLSDIFFGSFIKPLLHTHIYIVIVGFAAACQCAGTACRLCILFVSLL